jgi:hypothetical protein
LTATTTVKNEQRDDQQVSDPALREMDQIIAHHREREREEREQQHGRAALEAIQRVHGLRGQDLIERVEADVGDQGNDPDQQSAHVAELWARLDHLRQAELRALGRMKGHEKRAEGAA